MSSGSDAGGAPAPFPHSAPSSPLRSAPAPGPATPRATLPRGPVSPAPRAAKVRIRNPLRGVISQQILGAKFVADIAESLIELRKRTGIKIFAARMREKF